MHQIHRTEEVPLSFQTVASCCDHCTGNQHRHVGTAKENDQKSASMYHTSTDHQVSLSSKLYKEWCQKVGHDGTFQTLTADSALAQFFAHVLYHKTEGNFLIFHAGNDKIVIESILTRDTAGSSMTEILNYLNHHYQTATLSDTAGHFGYSASHFSTLIKEGTGRTFLQIIRDIKLNQACRALRETNLSIPSICELVGYETPEHFMRTFKKAYGMTPGEYRRKPS